MPRRRFVDRPPDVQLEAYGRFIDRPDAIQIELRMGHMRRMQGKLPRLRMNLRALGAVGPHVRAPGSSARGAVVKVWRASPSATASHLYYLRHGKGEEGTDAALYTREGDVVDAKGFARDAMNDPHQFRFIVSLNDAHRMPLQPYIQALMKRVEADLARPIDWVAATHLDTPHKHAHVVLRGRDLRGKELYLFSHYLHHGLRARAREVATEFLGPVPVQERTHEREQTRALAQVLTQHMHETKKQGGNGMDDDGRPPIDRDLNSTPDQPTTPSTEPTLLQRLEAILAQITARQATRTQEASREQDQGVSY